MYEALIALFAPTAPPAALAWPLAICVAWLAGELAHKATRLPRISIYGLVGFALAHAQGGFLPEEQGQAVKMLANIAFGLVLFEFGYRVNLHWLRANPWITVTAVVESLLTFGAVFLVARGFDAPNSTALMIAALVMPTSPAAILRVVNEGQSTGQVTERILHIAAVNCILAVFTFKVLVGIHLFRFSGDLLHAAWNSLAVLVISGCIGGCLGVAIPACLRRVDGAMRDQTVAFALGVVVLVALTLTLKLSPLAATLVFGLTARHRRVLFSKTQRNFGSMGDILSVFLFVYLSTTLDWHHAVAGAWLGLALVAVRLAVKTSVVTGFAHLTGTSWTKGACTGIALGPAAAFIILLLEQTRHLGLSLNESLAPLTATVLLLELAGPIMTQRALIWAREIPKTGEA